MNNVISTTLKLTVLAAVISGCTMMPKYQQPVSPAAAAWPTGTAYPAQGVRGTPAADIAWRDYFADERLKKLIALTLANNRDLRVSALNIDKARAQYRIEHAALLPSVAAGASQNAQRTADNLSVGGQGGVNRQYGVNLGVAAWEVDLFGRVRSLSEAALQTYLGTEEARASVQIALVAEMANAYLTLMADQERLALAHQTLSSQQRSLALSESRVKAGAAAGLDLYQARTTVETARADAAAYTAQVAQDRNALSLLAGAAVPIELLPPAGLAGVTALLEVGPGLPSDLLYRRPDVLAAERTLQASNANIGAARAAFFPRITLTGQAGTASSSLSGLFEGGSGAWSFAPSISLPIFSGGANRANLEVAKVNRDIGVAQYEKTIQVAFREVADALAQRGTVDERLAAQQQLVEASGKSYRIYEARYKNGADTFQNALIAQRALYAAQQGLISVKLAEQASRVTLYKVLGGGWRAGDGATVALAPQEQGATVR